jgi:hypothetical protein
MMAMSIVSQFSKIGSVAGFVYMLPLEAAT